MSIRRWAFIILGIVSLAVPARAFAQSERGTVTGVVRDSTNAVVPGVAVTVLNVETNAATNVITSDSGTYSAVNLPPGTYRVQAVLEGFQTSIAEGVIVTPGGAARVDLTLSAGGVTSEIKVTADTTPLHTEDARSVTAVSNKLIDELPLVVGGAMRSPFDLIATVPEARGSGGTVSLGGGQGGAYGATLDGVSVNTNRNADATETAFLTPSLEAITEFSVETNGFKPEFGQAGGGVITFASKSGTNTLRGSVYEFHRNDAFDARGFFERTKGIYKQNDYGGSLGGPVRIPRLYDGTNKTFFFASYEGFRNRQGSNDAFRSVPTPEMWDGDFSNWVDSQGRRLVIYDPATTRPNPNGTGFIRDPFPNNKIPQERFSTVAKQYIALARSVLVPNRPGLTPGTFGYVNNNYVSEDRSTDRDDAQVQPEDRSYAEQPASPRATCSTARAMRPWLATNGATGLPAPFSDFQQNTFDGDLHRVSWDCGRLAARESFVHWREHVQQELVFAERRSGLAVESVYSQRGRLRSEHGHHLVLGVLDLGRLLVQRHGAAASDHQERHDVPRRRAHVQGRRPVRSPAGERLRPAGLRRPRRVRLQANRAAGGDAVHQRQLVRLLPARLRGFGPYRDHPLSAADLSVLRLLRAGRLARERQTGRQLRRALRVHASAESRRRSVFGLLADRTESRGERLSRRAGLRR